MIKTAPTILWLRRDLRLLDHAALFHALKTGNPVQPIFIFDEDILAHFPAKNDRRLSFIATMLFAIDEELKKRGGGLLVLHGKAQKAIPKLVHALSASHLVAAEDYEPETKKRDEFIRKTLHGSAEVQFVKDQVIFAPYEILKEDNTPYKVFTPYSKIWGANLTPVSTAPYTYVDKQCYYDVNTAKELAKKSGLQVLDISSGSKNLLKQIGRDFVQDDLWPVTNPRKRLRDFIHNKVSDYPRARDMMAEHGTSQLSPYLRFGLVSVRECARLAMEAGGNKWLSELIWREFYAMILYHFPESAHTEWNPKYRETLDWSHNEKHFIAWQEGKTGYPIVDAAMRQLLSEGWMHNRARMIVASFLTKHLRIDWRWGDKHFAQYLMDYDMASNVGGWQWAASTGTDAQPYFRVFNPTLQSEKFDPNGDYIRRYVPELRNVSIEDIHEPSKQGLLTHYYPPIVDHKLARQKAIEMFKSV